jgi:hypothetical protein
MKPRHASAVVTRSAYVKQVFSCDVDEWDRLPVQWRGFVLHNQHRQHNAKTVLAMIDRGLEAGTLSSDYDPQGVFDAFQGSAPA